jgi:hypothetical protein
MSIFVYICGMTKLEQFQSLNIKHIARVAGVDYTKVLNCLKEKYNSLTEQEETKLYNAIAKEVQKATLVLGFTYDGKRVKRVS